MQPKTEEFLYFLLWSAEQLTRPTFRNLNGSFENWAYRNGLQRQLATLEKEKFLERKESAAARTRLYRLTSKGRLHALGGRDPVAHWSRPWDGRWRLVLFDVPLAQNKRRSRLRRYLHARGFGYLQNSVWITPHSMAAEIEALRGAKADVESLVLLEARPCAGETDAEIVTGSWDFEFINRRYQRHLDILKARPAGRLSSPGQAKAMHRWAETEREAWIKAVRADPLLPRELLPPGYLGKRAWARRIETLGRARRILGSFSAGAGKLRSSS